MTDISRARAAQLSDEPWLDAGVRGRGLGGFAASASDLWNYRELFSMLTKRELKARYKDSRLGFVWSLVRPLTMLFVYALVVGEFLGAARSIPDFGIYIFAGLAIYTLFSETVGAGTSSIITNSGLIKKVYLPREIFPLSTIGPALFTLAIQLAILIVAALVAGTLTFGWHLVYALLSTVLIVILSSALVLVLSATNVYLRDIAYLVDVVLVLMMWGSPILYSIAMVQDRLAEGSFAWLLPIYINNPVTLSVLGFQEAFWQAGSSALYVPHLWLHMLVAIGVSAVLVVVCQRIFARLQGDFAQEL